MAYSETVSEILELFEDGASKNATQVKILHEDGVSISLQFRLNSETFRLKALTAPGGWFIHVHK
jgi:hypothetical protein